jgi:hypothetical protein
MGHPKGERSRLDTLPQRLSGQGSAYVPDRRVDGGYRPRPTGTSAPRPPLWPRRRAKAPLISRNRSAAFAIIRPRPSRGHGLESRRPLQLGLTSPSRRNPCAHRFVHADVGDPPPSGLHLLVRVRRSSMAWGSVPDPEFHRATATFGNPTSDCSGPCRWTCRRTTDTTDGGGVVLPEESGGMIFDWRSARRVMEQGRAGIRGLRPDGACSRRVR